MAGWLRGVCVSACGFSLSLFCNYLNCGGVGPHGGGLEHLEGPLSTLNTNEYKQ